MSDDRPVDLQRLVERVERVENDLAVQLKGRDERERDVARALELSQLAIDKLAELAHRPDLVMVLSKLHDVLAEAARLEALIKEARALGEALDPLLDTAREDRRLQQPWYRRLFGRHE